MKWVMKDPVPGDMIRVQTGSIYHFGIYVSDEEVIQFGLAPSMRAVLKDSEVEVLASDIDTFLAGGFLEVCEFSKKERKNHRSQDEIIKYARAKIGTRGYSIIYNNCEHFANECVSGEHISRQADDVRELFRNMPVVDVYLAQLPNRETEGDIVCSLRQKEIDGISNENVKREKFFVWKLLGYALERSFGIKIADLEFTKTDDGRYITDKAEFSLSHSKGALAVAVSRKAVGVDVEAADTAVREGMAERIMTKKELDYYNNLADNDKKSYFVRVWTAKEALFKESCTASFNPVLFDTSESSVRSFEKSIGDKQYFVSVATCTPEKIRIFENIQL